MIMQISKLFHAVEETRLQKPLMKYLDLFRNEFPSRIPPTRNVHHEISIEGDGKPIP